MTNQKRRSTIYPTFWRPQLIAGVTRYYLTFCACCGLVPYLAAGFFFKLSPIFAILLGILVAGCFWIYGTLKAKDDPEFFDVYVVKFLNFDAKNSSDGNKYEP